MKPIQVGGTLVISIIRLSTFLPSFSMADKVPDLQKSEMMSGYLIMKTVLTFYDLFLPFPTECLRLRVCSIFTLSMFEDLIISLVLISYGFF